MATAALVSASTTHVTSGTGGSHQSGSHSFNLPHAKVSIGADHAGSITSGSLFHDNCSGTSCFGAFGGSDWALDIGAGAGGQASYLYADYDFSDTGGSATNPIDNNKLIRVDAKAASAVTYFPGHSGDAACRYQKFDIRLSYTDTSGVAHNYLVVGSLWIAHLTNWQYSSGWVAGANATRSNPLGTGSIYYLSGKHIGNVYAGSDTNGAVCSNGPHSHMEFYSAHGWGSAYEWHSLLGPDAYDTRLASVSSNHIHWGTGYGHTAASDPVTAGMKLGRFGGNKTKFYLQTNPHPSTPNH